VAKLAAVFRVANKHKLALTIHMATGENDYDGRAAATVFLNQLLPAAPDVPVQIAHMTGDAGYSNQIDAALGVFADAISSRDPRVRNLYFDGVVMENPDPRLVQRMRQIGLDRILFGSDRHAPNNAPPADAWKAWRKNFPFTDAEFRSIADNVVEYRK
jgi:predicted TIM-barrel fold metal-dependent hydrolase